MLDLKYVSRYLNSGRDFLSIDINFNVKIKGYDLSYFYQKGTIFLLFNSFVFMGKATTVNIKERRPEFGGK